jgi:transcription antitermination factor NusG
MSMNTEKVWRIGDMVGLLPLAEPVDPWPERTAGKAFWYVAHTMAGCEKRLADQLTEMGFGTYVPKRSFIRRRPGGRAVRVDQPVFARYVFVELVPHPRCWVAVRQARDLLGILTNQDAPVRLADEAVGDLMAAEDMKLFDDTVLPNAVEILRGDRVSIIGGNWQGYEATVTSRARRSVQLKITGPKGICNAKVPVDLLRILA